MSSIKAYQIQNTAILRINSEKEFIDVEPLYQRKGDVWTLEKKQLLIDSIINEFDIPKLYFHDVSSNKNNKYDYAVIDGRQRLEAIWGFVDDEFAISDEFEYFKDQSIDARSLKYSDLAKKYPKLKIIFDSTSLPIICVETDDLDLIEDMFSRLNEAVPLSSAEKRNAIGGPMASAIREIADHKFFTEKVQFSNTRYQHREVAARLLFIIQSLRSKNKIIDTKKPYLDDMVKKFKKENRGRDLKAILSQTKELLKNLNSVFSDNDPLLRAQSIVPIYFLTMREALKKDRSDCFIRYEIVEFFNKVKDNRKLAETDIASANYELLEFDRMSQQGTNDAMSIETRVKILSKYLKIHDFISDFLGSDKDVKINKIEEIIADSLWDLDSEDSVSSAIAETNATGFGVDDIQNIEYEIDKESNIIEVSFYYHMTGEQDPDKPFCGDEIEGSCSGAIDEEGRFTLFDVTAAVDRNWD